MTEIDALHLVCTPEMKEYFKNMSFDISISQEIFDLRDEATKIRRYLHKHPELSFKEYNTSNYIMKHLNKLNNSSTLKLEPKLEIKKGFGNAKTSITCLLKGRKSRSKAFCIGIRGDIDALPIAEEDNELNASYKSTNANVMHACGHDGHTAILLLTISILCKYQSYLSGNILFIFESGEEIGQGANEIIKHSNINSIIDEIYTLHIASDLEVCSFGINKYPETLLAGNSNVIIQIVGQSGHGALPHKANDVIIPMNTLINQIQSIVSRNVNPNHSCVITIGKINVGYSHNIIADKCDMYLTIRYYNNNDKILIFQRMKQICNGIEMGFNVKINVKQIQKDCPPVINDIECYDNVCNSAKKMYGKNGLLLNLEKAPFSDDFSQFLQFTKGAYFVIGGRVNPPIDKPNQIYEHHTSNFKFDERMLIVGCQLFVQLIFDIFDKQLKIREKKMLQLRSNL